MIARITLASIGNSTESPHFAVENSMIVIDGVTDGKDRCRSRHSCVRYSRQHARVLEV